jgi:hypothetical protein
MRARSTYGVLLRRAFEAGRKGLSSLAPSRPPGRAQELVHAAHRLARAVYDVPTPHTDRPGEVGDLARALEAARTHLQRAGPDRASAEVLIDFAREGIIIHCEFAVVYANAAAQRMLDLDTHPEGWSELFADRRPEIETQFRSLPAGTSHVHVRRLCIDEGRRWLDMMTRPIEWGGRRCLVSSLIDVTDQVRAERAAEQQRVAEAEAKNKEQMLANMSHELRTPMTGVLGMADLLLQSGPSREQRKLLTGLRSSADLLLTLLNDVLDLSKLEANALRLERIDFDLRQAVTTVTQLLSPKASEKALALTVAIDDDVPMAVRGDPARLQQILFNLIGNALKFTDEGQVQVRVTGGERDGMAHLRFEVNDSGIGIPEERIPQLFHRFQQGDESTTRRYGGTGLGLAISKKLTEMMGGEIGVHSQLGRGSTFHVQVCLPVGDPSEVGAPTPLDHRLRLGWAKGRTLLLAEDQDVNRLMLKMLLEGEGFHVTAVEHGAEAVEAMHRQPFDLVVMDMHMPVMSGAEATRAIRRMATERPPIIIGLTADAVVEHRNQYLSVGLDAFLTKPFERNQFAALAYELLTKRTAPPEPAAAARPSEAETPRGVALDRQRLRHLQESVGTRNLERLLDKFTRQARDEAEQLETALLSGTDADVRYRAHRLAGFAGNFGAVRLAEWARELNAHPEVEPTGALDELNRLVEEAIHAVEHWLVEAPQ